MLDYREIWVLDAEYKADPGERPIVHCLVAHELNSGRRLRLWADQLFECPFDTGDDNLFVAFFASAEWGAFLSLGWAPTRQCYLPARRVPAADQTAIAARR